MEMSYHGKVEPGGPSDLRELSQLTITKFAVSEMSNNVYLLRCRATDEQLLVDAADDAAHILEVRGERASTAASACASRGAGFLFFERV